MYRLFVFAALASVAFVTSSQAQDNIPELNVNPPRPQAQAREDGQGDEQAAPVSMTPEAWQYLKDSHVQQSARELIFRRASFRAAQREMRIASRDWYGVSLSRPMASPVPFMGVYSAYWAGTYRDPSVWTAQSPYLNYRVTDEGLR